MNESKVTEHSPGLGISLSGGGLRAAFFHIGVLAHLAERDLLRQVEVISTVSGGSILGAAYYLKLQTLLESKEDAEIQAEDYVRLVEELERWFLEVVQTNLRMQAYSSFVGSWRVTFKQGYSRSDRLGELYDQLFYRPLFAKTLEVRARRIDELGAAAIAAAAEMRASKKRRVRMTDLHIYPPGQSRRFSLSEVNSQRRCKIPTLVVNASTLNTGRHWQFRVTWMGEVSHKMASGQEEADTNAVFEGLHYPEAADPRYEHFSLGNAVAASACVPGLFPPLPLSELYPDWQPQLVDGGVHDNQGIAALLQAQCRAILVSDGSGQLTDEMHSSAFRLFVILRTKELLQDRIRDLGLTNILGRPPKRPGAVVHLRDGLSPTRLRPRLKPEAVRAPLPEPASAPYGVSETFQEALARVRTDLDAFSDVEADALMASAYLICNHKLKDFEVPGAQAATAVRKGDFRFRWISPRLGDAATEPLLLRHLTRAKERLLKPIFLYVPQFSIIVTLLTLGFMQLVTEAIWGWHGAHSIQLRWESWTAPLVALLFGLLSWVEYECNGTSAFLTMVVVTPVAKLYLWCLNPIFLWAGSRAKHRRGPTRPIWLRMR